MDDSCAVCAETLEWVAYGPCGHREVCSTCVARLRFICDDRRCCICKSESDSVFVTKALGDYTTIISDFSVLPSDSKEGRVGLYWYHEDTQSFFDDLDHYKMIKAMCRLSCSVCDQMEEDGSKRRARFRNIEQLKGHLFHQHRVILLASFQMGQVFICEQKLYTRGQLNRHINTGDSEVDGTESERGGFTGHPLCEFCRTPFYGDNELYSHMSTEHYTCHICQRQHPGQYEYYKNYDDLEIHFRREHFLCEDEACLAKKFVVFLSESEMKIPTSFRYRQSNEHDTRRGRGRTFRREYSDDQDQLSLAIEASYETSNGDAPLHGPSSSSREIISGHGMTNDIDPIIQPFESLATTDSEPPSRYRQALSQKSSSAPLEESSFPPLPVAPNSTSQQKSKQEPSQALSRKSRNAQLEESSFPPLPMAPSSSKQKSKHEPESLPRNTMASHLRHQKNINDLRHQNHRNVTPPNSDQAWPAASRTPVLPATGPIFTKPATNGTPGLSYSSGLNTPAMDNGPASSSYSSLARIQPASVHEPSLAGSSSSLRKMGSISRISHSTSAPNLAHSASFEPSTSDFPPVSATQIRKLPSNGQVRLKEEDVRTANKSLVERMQSALEFDEGKFTAFKEISGEYRQGFIDAGTYLACVEQFGLSHLVIELARLCPDPGKQIALVEAYNATLINSGPRENGSSQERVHMNNGNGSNKGKGKFLDSGGNGSEENLADSILNTVRKLQSSYKPLEEEVEVLSRDGYRSSKGKAKVMVNEPQAEMSSLGQPPVKMKGGNDSLSAGGGSGQNLEESGGKGKQRKKTSKFHRVRLGDGSVAAFLDRKNADPDQDPDVKEATSDANKNTVDGLPVRGVWRHGGGQKLLARTAGDPKK
ncbi:hypothetical protein RHGRI_035478 [Rhododendron griersonianum]|uniref:RING-type E3 ubiquitin transferase n=1 Tax=Rhododendron griersonianum TaxID=479676 RepID=A0AAV6HPV0_9ERIC|nr:hypothetical protein RHGRI_035478 [Rhododendron griersonianum]